MSSNEIHGGGRPDAARQLRYVLPVEVIPVARHRQLLSRELVTVIWRHRWLILIFTMTCTALAMTYAYFAIELYRAETVLQPVKVKQGLAAQLGNVAALARFAGVNIEDGADDVEALAVLRSKEFARDFLAEENLLPVLFPDRWDQHVGGWKASNPRKWPDLRDGVRYFEKSVMRVVEDKRSGLVTLSIEWRDPAVAAKWANLLVTRVNERMRTRALRESQANIKALGDELKSASLVSLQQSIGVVLQGEYQALMLARTNSEYAFRVIDPATAPKWHSSPKRLLLVVAAFIGGLALIVLWLIGQFVASRGRGSDLGAAEPMRHT